MKKVRLIALILCLMILVLLPACKGYNSIMRKHLGNKENYDSYCGKICDIYYVDEEYNKVSILSSNDIPERDVIMELTFEDYDTVEKFLGGRTYPERSLDELEIIFDITKENNQILIENGFYDVVTLDTPITISASRYIYMDTNFFYIAAITYNGTEYLCFQDGFENIVKYINDNKSLL